jgi:hypothetical protein
LCALPISAASLHNFVTGVASGGYRFLDLP